MKYDIGLVCMMNYNIGNCLTNWALYSVLKGIGKSVLMINVHEDAPYSWLIKQEGALKYFGISPYEAEDIIICRDKSDIYELNKKCKYFILGSDQVWRMKFMKDMEYHTSLNWVYSSKCKRRRKNNIW